MRVDIRRLGPGDELLLTQVAHCFDGPVRDAAATRFLNADGHHILVAYDGENAVGFISGVEMTHPDKGTEMFLYELAVDASYQRQGYGAALVKALAGIARARSCYGMWVGTEEDNAGALATYAAAGAVREANAAILVWKFCDADVDLGGGRTTFG
jgi:ribosomal protein S18 acetylase RimI-like enzyme